MYKFYITKETVAYKFLVLKKKKKKKKKNWKKKIKKKNFNLKIKRKKITFKWIFCALSSVVVNIN